IYELKKIHGLKFYHDILQGSVQAVGPTNPGIIKEYQDFETAKRARADQPDAAGPDENAGENDREELTP
ncbi:hypothetical protein PF005_g29809, partial [Phytophthora fragariae]